MALKSNGVTQVPDGLGTAGKVLKVNSAGTAGEWGTINSNDLTEGSTNLFYTDARADARAALLVDSAPGTLDTLNELAAALGDDANFSTTVTNSIATKLPLAGGTLTGNVNFGDDDKAIFGASNDLQIYHDGSGNHTKIENINSTASVSFRSNGPVMQWWDTQYGGYYIHAARNGAVSLAYARATKLATTSTGVNVTGSLSAESISVNTGTPVSSSPSAHFRRNHGAQAYQQLSGLALYWNTSNGLQDNTIVYGASTNSSLKFTHADGTTFNDRLIISSSGNVGIGTATPATILDISASGANGITLNEDTNNASLSSRIFLNNGTAGKAISIMNNGNNLSISTGATPGSGSGSEKVRILENGFVGIGTTSPNEKLHVQSAVVSGKHLDLASDLLVEGTDTRLQIMASDTGANGSAMILSTEDHHWIHHAHATSASNMYSLGYYNSTATGFDGAQNSSEIFNITTDGNVGIGTSSPSNILHVHGGGDSVYSIVARSDTKWMYLHSGGSDPAIGWDTNGSMRFGTSPSNVGSGFSEKMRINSSGNVGIGTTSPSGKLAVYTTARNTAGGYNGQNFGIIVGTDNQDDTGDDGNGIVFTQQYAADGVDSSQVRTGAIIGYKGQASGNFGGGLKLFVQPTGATSMSNVMTLTKDSKVGIGTTSPAYKLDFDVGSTIRLRHTANGSAIRVGASDYDVNLIRFDGSQGITDNSYYGGALRYMGSRSGNTNSLSVFMDNALGTEVEAMTFLQDGKVGIGTTSPSSKLHVAGSLRADSTILDSLAVNTGSNPFTVGGVPKLAVVAADGDVPITIGSSNSDLMYIRNQTGTGEFCFQTYNGNNDGEIHLQPYGGKVGIGTTNPSNQLHLQKSADTGIVIENSASSMATLSLLATGAGRVRSSGHLIFDTGGSTEHMRIESSGRVGIGVTTPNTLLDVKGLVNSSGIIGAESTSGDAYTQNSFNNAPIITVKSPNAVDNYSGIRYTNSVGNYEWYAGTHQYDSDRADYVFQGYYRSGGGYNEKMRIREDGSIRRKFSYHTSWNGSSVLIANLIGINGFSSTNCRGEISIMATENNLNASFAKYMFVVSYYSPNGNFYVNLTQTGRAKVNNSFGDGFVHLTNQQYNSTNQTYSTGSNAASNIYARTGGSYGTMKISIDFYDHN